MKKSLLIILTCLSAHCANAYYFRSYQIEDGLSHNSVWAVMQDKEGFMWFGTNDGLNRFDGKSFKVFKKNENDSFDDWDDEWDDDECCCDDDECCCTDSDVDKSVKVEPYEK